MVFSFCIKPNELRSTRTYFFASFEMSSNSRGAGYWKMNVSHLSNSDLLQKLSECVVSSNAESNSPTQNWEKMKKSVKEIMQKFARQQASERSLVISQLMENIDLLQDNLLLSESDTKILSNSIIELNQHLQEESQKIIFRSRAKWYKEGEKNTRYFYTLEKARYNSKTCSALIHNSKIYTQDEEILELQRKYFEQLYQARVRVEYHISYESPTRLTEEEKEDMNQEISINDIREAILQLNDSKTPGKDGIPAEFYKKMINVISVPMLQVINYVFDTDKLHESASLGVLNVTPKPGKDSRYIDNLRPITLLNTDYKVIEKIVVNRILKVIDKLVHGDQRGFMPQCRILVNIHRLLDISEILKRKEETGLVLSLDYSKAFDKVSFNALEGSLKFFNFPELIVKWTKIFYQDFIIQVQNNGKFSKEFKVRRGIYQGGVCSATYFVLVVEAMAQDIRRDEQIEGIQIRNTVCKLNLFADDTDSFSNYKQQSLNALMNKLAKYRFITGLEINYNKTSLYRIGSLKKSVARLYAKENVRWAENFISVLGIKIYQDTDELVKHNFQPIIDSITSITTAWKYRGLSLIGKVNVINTLVASLFIYKMTVLPNIPKKMVQKINSLISDFLWDGKKRRSSYLHYSRKRIKEDLT